jgi:hypothetical protein
MGEHFNPPNFKVEHLANFGTSEPWLARAYLGIADLIAATPLNADPKVTEALGNVFYGLVDAFNDLRRLRDLTADDKTPVSELNAAYSSFYGHVWRAYKDRFQAFVQTLGVDLGFLWKNDKEFNAIAPKFLLKHPVLGEVFMDMLADERATWQIKLAKFRNEHLEHHKDLPAGFVEPFYTLQQAELSFQNVWQAMEDIAAHVIALQFPNGVTLVEIPEEQRDAGNERRFGFHVPGLSR